MHRASWNRIIAHKAHFRDGTILQQVLRTVVSSIDPKADGSCLSLDNFPKGVSCDGSSLDVAQIDQVLVHEDLATLLLIVRLHSPEKSVCALLNGRG